MARSDWSIERTKHGDFRILWKDREWPVRKATRDRAEAYVTRLCQRYPGTTPATVLGDEEEPEENSRSRGGPWQYEYETDDGVQSGIIETRRKKDAKQILRRRLDRQRLPNGIEWKIPPGREPVPR